MPSDRILFWFVMGLLLFGFGLWMIVREVLRLHYIRTWPRAKAQIVISKVVERVDGDGDTVYEPHVEYAYFQGETLRISEASLSAVAETTREEAERVCARYPVGRELLIAYDPRSKSLTEIADEEQYQLKMPVIITGFILVGFGAFWSYMMSRWAAGTALWP